MVAVTPFATVSFNSQLFKVLHKTSSPKIDTTHQYQLCNHPTNQQIRTINMIKTNKSRKISTHNQQVSFNMIHVSGVIPVLLLLLFIEK